MNTRQLRISNSTFQTSFWMIGRTVSHYRVAERLGGGGMGVVYKALDLKLGRDVALKCLTADFSRHPVAMERLRQEARAASALNHPNICTIFDIDEDDGQPFIVMECLQGHTLKNYLEGKPLQIELLLELGIQIADALAAAHHQGIVHRDIKPANIFITSAGQAKVLDFGVAKVVGERSAAHATVNIARATDDDSTDIQLTQPGSAPGTLAYMSPEQVNGDNVDAQSDIFSFGAVLYLMATGRQAFDSPNPAAICNAILHESPRPSSSLNAALPKQLDAIISKALEKNRARRYGAADKLTNDLKRLKREIETGSAELHLDVLAGGRKPLISVWTITLATAALLLLIVGLHWLFWRGVPKLTDYRQITSDGRQKYIDAMMVTDGARLYFIEDIGGRRALAQVSAGGGDTTPISTPFPNVDIQDLSHSGSELLIEDETLTALDGQLLVLSLSSDQARPLGDVHGHAAAWSPDGREIAYIRGTDLRVTRDFGLSSQSLAALPHYAHWLRWSPDGKRLRFTVTDPVGRSNSLWEISANGSNLHPLLPAWRKPQNECCGSWTADGAYFVFAASTGENSSLWARRESSFVREPADPFQLAAGPTPFFAPTPDRQGTRVFALGQHGRGELLRYDALSHQMVGFMPGLSAEGLEFSRDRQSVAYVTYPQGDLWRSAADGSNRLQLTFEPLRAYLPRWSPDGSRIAFMGSLPGEPMKIYWVEANGGTPKKLTGTAEAEADPTWSHDGNSIAFSEPLFPGRQPQIHVFSFVTQQVSTLPESSGLFSPRWSPDGRYITAVATSQNRLALFDFSTHRWSDLLRVRVKYPNWSHDGRYIYFEGKGPTLCRIELASRRLEQLANIKDLQPTGFFAEWTGLTSEDHPIVLRDVRTQEIWSAEWR